MLAPKGKPKSEVRLNHGGALADIRGRVIGIPTLAASNAQMGGAAAGIGFAVPSSVVKDVANQIIKYGHVVNSHRAYLGVTISDTGSGVYISSGRRAGRECRHWRPRRDHVSRRQANADLRPTRRRTGRLPPRPISQTEDPALRPARTNTSNRAAHPSRAARAHQSHR